MLGICAANTPQLVYILGAQIGYIFNIGLMTTLGRDMVV